MTERKTRRIVILGGGFGGAYCAQPLEKRLRRFDAETYLIDQHNYFIFYPFLVEAGTGSLEPRHAVVSIRDFLKTTAFRMAKIQHVDVERSSVRYQLAGNHFIQRMEYDHLVLALGSVTNLPKVSGLREYGFEMKDLRDTVTLRDRAIHLLELADATRDPKRRRELLHFVVIGGNYTGVEVAGEIHVFLNHASRLYRNVAREECRVTLIELSERILPALDEDLAAYALRKLTRRGIQVLLWNTATEIHADHLILKSGKKLPTHTVLWCAGVAPPPLLQSLTLPVDQRGYVLCEPDLRVRGFDNVWAIGDCAINPGPDGQPYPPTAQHAIREGIHLATNIVRVFREQPTIPCKIRPQGSLAALGCRTAVAKVFGLKLAGFPAWFLWRTVYLLKMPGLSRKARVALDWSLDLVFKRNYVELGLHEKRVKSTSHIDNPQGQNT
jgi:NADH dehydrogenase